MEPVDLRRALAVDEDKLTIAQGADLLFGDHGFEHYMRLNSCSVCHEDLAGIELADKRLHARCCPANAFS